MKSRNGSLRENVRLIQTKVLRFSKDATHGRSNDANTGDLKPCRIVKKAPMTEAVAAAVALGTILTFLAGSIVNVALPHMQRSFGVGVDRISWVVTGYLAAVRMNPTSGWTAVRIGRRRYLLISVVLFVAASALCGSPRASARWFDPGAVSAGNSPKVSYRLHICCSQWHSVDAAQRILRDVSWMRSIQNTSLGV